MNIFNYDSKFNQAVMMAADMIILNLLYIVCCIPIVTIGAAQAGLFTGIRVLLDKEDDTSVAKAFFRGFSNGFGKVTIVTTILAVVIAALVLLLGWVLMFFWGVGGTAATVALVLNILALVVFVVMLNVLGPFHATFGCTASQLMRNIFFVSMAYPLRSLVVTALMLVPLAVLLISPSLFMGSVVAILAIYFSVVYLACFALMKAPFQRLKDNFHAAQESAEDGGEDEPEEDAPEDEEDPT